ncbi:hypothetical protein TKK_0009114 [Trichogramma kaykai]|uniref:BTB domain-containing protein n=1 Tax=Trichogramma kaykai TaxID=54128 RepID=A0ABD2X4Z6_9HYME
MAEPELKPNHVIAGSFKYQVEYNYRQEWILENYDMLTTIRPGMDPRMVIRSQSFYSPCDGNDYEWQLILYPNGFEDKTHVSLFVEYLDQDNVIASVRLSILDAERNSYVEAFVRGRNFHARDRVYGATRLLPKYLLDEPYGVVTKNQELHVVCEVSLDHVPKQSRRLLHLTWRAIEFESYARLYNEGLPGADKDVVLTTSDKKKLYLHKLILQSRSQILKTMLELKKPENGKINIYIEDYDYKTLKEVCRFIYCGRVEVIDGVAADMLVAAKSLEMPGLAHICEQCLIDHITPDKAMDYLQLAERAHSENLKHKTLNYIAFNSAKVIRAKEEDFEESCEKLKKKTVAELLQVMSDMINREEDDDDDDDL